MKVIGKSDIGKVRDNNEDSFYIHNSKKSIFPNIYIVADGMGGHNAGEIASSLSIEYFLQYINDCNTNQNNILKLMVEATMFSNEKVYSLSLSKKHLNGMGTTFTCATVFENEIFIAHVGDSRAYLLTQTEISQLTNDHTYVNEIYKLGKIKESEMSNHPKKHMLTKALGTTENLEVDYHSFEINNQDKLILCSDGLTNTITNKEIFNIVKNNNDINVSVDELIKLSNDRGGMDNITVILAEITEVDL